MKNFKYIFLFIVILSLSKGRQCSAQNFSKSEQKQLDNFNQIINNPSSHDTSLARAYIDLSEFLAFSNIDTVIPLSKKAIQIAEKRLAKNPNEQLKQALLIAVADGLNNIGYVHMNQGNIQKALTFYHKTLKILDKVDNKSILGSALNNIGIVYQSQGDIAKTMEYWHQALKVREEALDKEGIANSLYNIAHIHMDQSNPVKALEYIKRALKIQEEIGQKEGMAYSLNSIGVIHLKNGDISKAKEYYNKSLKVREEIGDKNGISSSLNNIGYAFFGNGNLPEALSYAQHGFKIANEVGYPANIKSSSKLLSKIYEKQEKGIKALEMYKLYIAMRDSLNNDATQKNTIKQQAKYEYEKQKTIDDAENEKLIAIEKEEKEKQQILTIATGVGLGLVVVFLLFLFNRLRITKKQKILIEEQKQEVEQQKGVVEATHYKLEEKNQEITDSILYAKRIQSAILPTNKVVKEYLKESFILYKPKDIVAGDFYWLETISNKKKNSTLILFAAADCTGHGVPGAMVSVVCNNALNRSIRESGLSDPGEILTKTREIVIKEFEKSDEEVKDGMDIALCSLEGSTLKYAGAHNPLWIVRGGEILETKADKQPVGQFDNPLPYTTHSFDLETGDSIYIFSDGYIDQFGGEKGKKFKAMAFRELLLSVQDKTMEEQKTSIGEAFETWKGNLEQIDDVCVIGVKI